MYTLNDICTLITDGSHFSPEDEGEGYPMLSVKDMDEDDFCFTSCKHVGEEAYQKLLSNGCKPLLNDVVLAKDGSFLKTAFPIREEREIALLSSIAILRPKTNIVDPEYLSYFLKSKQVYRTVSLNYISGTALKRIILKGIKKIPIQLPDMKEQEHRSALLNAVRRIIRLKQEEIDKLDDLIKARFVEMFGNPIINDKKWEQKSLESITTKIGSGATPKGGKESYKEDGISLIRSMNVHNGFFEYKDLAHISDEQASQLDNVTVQENDVLLNITGASVARCCTVPTNVLPARVNQHVCIIRCCDKIIPEFLEKMMIDDYFQNYLWSVAGSGATREAITKQQIESFQIIIPPLSLQNDFVSFVKQIDKSKVAVQKALDETKLLFDSLMQQYFG